MTAQVLSALAGLLIARLLGPAEYGVYATAFALPSALMHAFLFGLDSIVPREIARKSHDSGKIIASSLIPATFWSLALSLLIVGLGFLLGYPRRIVMLLLLTAPAMGARSLTNLMRSVFRGFERMEADAFIQIANGVGILAIVGLALTLSRSVHAAVVATLLAEWITLAGAVAAVWRLTGFQCDYNAGMASALIAGAVPLGITFAIVGVGLRLDMLVLSLLSSSQEVGLYSAAFGCMILSRPLSLLPSALLPRLSKLAGSADEEFASLCEKGLRYTLFAGCAIGLVTSMSAPFLLNALYGPTFREAAPALRWLGITALLLFVNTYLWHVLIAWNSQKWIALSVLAGTVTALVFSLALIPYLGIIGAALAAVAREGCQLAMLSRYVAKKVRLVGVRNTIVSTLWAGLTFGASLWVVRDRTDAGVLLIIPFAFILFLAMLVVTGGIEASDLRTVRDGLPRWIRAPFSRRERKICG